MQWDDLKVTGLQVQYLKVCERKLWLHAHQIGFEDEYDKVQQGKVLHETSYQRKKSKEVLIDNLIRIDLLDGDYVGKVKSRWWGLTKRSYCTIYLYWIKWASNERVKYIIQRRSV